MAIAAEDVGIADVLDFDSRWQQDQPDDYKPSAQEKKRAPEILLRGFMNGNALKLSRLKAQGSCGYEADDHRRFFSFQDEDITAAKQLCEDCPVRQECLDYAVEFGETDGIWGGLTADERGSLQPFNYQMAERLFWRLLEGPLAAETNNGVTKQVATLLDRPGQTAFSLIKSLIAHRLIECQWSGVDKPRPAKIEILQDGRHWLADYLEGRHVESLAVVTEPVHEPEAVPELPPTPTTTEPERRWTLPVKDMHGFTMFMADTCRCEVCCQAFQDHLDGPMYNRAKQVVLALMRACGNPPPVVKRETAAEAMARVRAEKVAGNNRRHSVRKPMVDPAVKAAAKAQQALEKAAAKAAHKDETARRLAELKALKQFEADFRATFTDVLYRLVPRRPTTTKGEPMIKLGPAERRLLGFLYEQPDRRCDGEGGGSAITAHCKTIGCSPTALPGLLRKQKDLGRIVLEKPSEDARKITAFYLTEAGVKLVEDWMEERNISIEELRADKAEMALRLAERPAKPVAGDKPLKVSWPKGIDPAELMERLVLRSTAVLAENAALKAWQGETAAAIDNLSERVERLAAGNQQLNELLRLGDQELAEAQHRARVAEEKLAEAEARLAAMEVAELPPPPIPLHRPGHLPEPDAVDEALDRMVAGPSA